MYTFYFSDEIDGMTIADIKKQLRKIEEKGFIPVPVGLEKRKDTGFVGQVLEREFGIPENNHNSSDMGNLELKAKRLTSVSAAGRKHNGAGGKLTLFHKNTDIGMSDTEIFNKFSYVAPSTRNGKLKRKLFTTCTGKKNNRGFSIRFNKSEERVELLHEGQMISGWGEDVNKGLRKIHNLLVVLAETRGAINTRREKFHYIKATLYQNCMPIEEAIEKGYIVIEFCMDSDLNSQKAPHDRGPHFRVKDLRTLEEMYESFEVIFDITKDKI